MSIAVLNQVYDEVRRIAIAGSAVAPGDFRLKKLIPLLEQAGKKSPVFAKVADSATSLVDSSEKTASTALLEMGTLINSILYTQGETGLEGKLEPIVSKDFGVSRTQTSARLIKPLIEALTTTGSGRLEVVKDSHARGLFKDLRLIRPAILALDDVYSEIADFIAAEVLPIYGNAIYPELESQFDLKGKSGQPRRLELMHRLDPVKARPWVQLALDEGSKEIRVAAIRCLGTSAEDLTFLLEQSKAKAKDVRAAALEGLSRLDAKDASNALIAVIHHSDLELALRPLHNTESPDVIAAVHSAIDEQAKKILSSKEKDKSKLGKEVSRLLSLLQCVTDRKDTGTEETLYALLEDRRKWEGLKADPGGLDVLEAVSTALCVGSTAMQRKLVSLHPELPIECFWNAFESACAALKPDDVFATFGAYLKSYTGPSKKGATKKSKDINHARAETLVEAIGDGYRWTRSRYSRLAYHAHAEPKTISSTLSPKWLDLAIEMDVRPLILQLAVSGNKKSNDALAKMYKELADGKSKDFYQISELIEVLIRLQHPDATDAMVQAIEGLSKSTASYGLYWLLRLIKNLPKDEAIPKLETLITRLPEKIAEQVVDHLIELKQQ